MEIREALPSEYDQVGDVVALAYEPFGTPGDEDWTQHLALVRNVADRAQRASDAETIRNPRARSATLRVAERTAVPYSRIEPGARWRN